MLLHFSFLSNYLQVILKQLQKLPCCALQLSHCNHPFSISAPSRPHSRAPVSLQKNETNFETGEKSSLALLHLSKFYFRINFKIVLLGNKRQS